MRRRSRYSLLPVLTLLFAAAAPGQTEMIDPPGATDIRQGADRGWADMVPAPRFPRRPALDRASRKELESLRRVDDEDRAGYSQFLKGGNTGIFKLFPDNGCTGKNLVRVDGDCEGFVADSSVYSFRTETYGRGGGDLFFFRNHFTGKRYFAQPIIVSIGDVPIENVTEAHPAAKVLAEYAPELTPAAAGRASSLIARGIERDGYRFAAAASASAGPTYLYRQIAFNVSGKVPKQRVRTRFGVFQVEVLKRNLQQQERKDTIYAFRVVRRDDDGALTIVWKQLSRKDAPAIVFEKGDKIPAFVWAMPAEAK